MIKPHHWLKIRRYAPAKLVPLINTCFEFESMTADLFKRFTNKEFTGQEIGELQILIQDIMTEYMKIIQINEQDQKIIGEVRSDMETTLSNWFDGKGNVKDLSNGFLMSLERGTLHFHLPLFITPSTGFIHARIFKSLLEAYEESLKGATLSVDTIGKIVHDKDWNYMKKRIYPELCLACEEFENYIEHIFRCHPYYNNLMIEDMNKHIFAVMEEYLRIIGDSRKDKALKEIISSDNPISDFIVFIDSLYYYIKVTKAKRDGTFLQAFVTSTKFKAKIFPHYQGGKTSDSHPPVGQTKVVNEVDIDLPPRAIK